MLLDTETTENPIVELLPDGVHKMVIVKCEHKLSPNEGFEIEWQEEQGKKKCFSSLFYAFQNEPEWASYSRDALRDLLWVFNIKKLETPEQAAKLSQWLIGKSCYVRTKQKSYINKNGEKKTAVNTTGFFNDDGVARSGLKVAVTKGQAAEDAPW